MSCIFCKFIDGSIKCSKVFENEAVLAFQDWNPWAPIHITVFPKAHVGLNKKGEAEFTAAIAAVEAAIPEIIAKAGIKTLLRIVRFDTEEHVTQNLEHFHYHILGSTETDAHLELRN